MYKEFLILLTLSKNGSFFGATWFLTSLFIVSVLYKILDSCLKFRYQSFILFAVFCIPAAIGFAVTFPYLISRAMILGLFYAAGVIIKEYQKELHRFDRPLAGIAAAFIFFIIARHNYINMGKNEYTFRLLFVISSFAAVYAVIWISRLMIHFCRILKNVFIFFGRRSIDIVLWQFIVFHTLSVLGVSGFSSWTLRWILYVLAGMLIPILIGNILRLGRLGKLLAGIHAVNPVN